jgi:hypothetical protein
MKSGRRNLIEDFFLWKKVPELNNCCPHAPLHGFLLLGPYHCFTTTLCMWLALSRDNVSKYLKIIMACQVLMPCRHYFDYPNWCVLLFGVMKCYNYSMRLSYFTEQSYQCSTHPKLRKFNFHNVTDSLISRNPRKRMFIVQIPLLIVTFLSLKSQFFLSLMQTTKEVNPHPLHCAMC